MRDLDRVKRFRQAADLVDLDQDRVADALLDAVGQADRIGHEQIVTDQLDLLADGGGEGCPAFPVVLGTCRPRSR